MKLTIEKKISKRKPEEKNYNSYIGYKWRQKYAYIPDKRKEKS